MKKLKFLLLGAIGLMACQLSAKEIDFLDGDLVGTFQTNLTYGCGMRIQAIDPGLVGGFNNNFDDGDLNYEPGDIFSSAFQGVWELDAMYKEKYGLFVRVNGLWDPLIMYSHPQRTKYSGTAKHILGRRLQLIDCNVRRGFEIGDRYVAVKIGSQVINWGESIFTSNGLNSIAPQDVAKLVVPGTFVKTALLPVWSARVDVQFSPEWSGFAWWQWHWMRSEFPPKGTYFAFTDFANPGGFFYMTEPTPPASDIDPAPGTFLRRKHSNRGTNRENFGFSIKYLAKDLNYTEFAFYAAISASNKRLISVYRGDPNDGLDGLATSRYFQDYPDGIKILGLSFNSAYGKLQFQGEYCIHIDQPIQLPGFPSEAINFDGGPSTYNETVRGYKRKSYSSWILGGRFNPGTLMGTNDAFVAFSFGANLIHNWEKNTFSGDPFAAGGTILYSITYHDVFWSVSLSPYAAFDFGLFGNIPSPLGTYAKNDYSLALGVGGAYLNNFSFSFDYTTAFWDRNNLTFTTTYTF